MKDERAIKRLNTLGKILSFGGMAIGILAVIIAFRNPEQLSVATLLALASFLTAQLGISLLNRWGRSPRIDEAFDQALKGLDSRFAVIHYLLGADHVLIGPPGVVALIPLYHEGRIEYCDSVWVQTRPRGRRSQKTVRKEIKGLDRQVMRSIDKVRDSVKRRYGEARMEDLTFSPLLVFVHPETKLQTIDTPLQSTHIKKLKTTLRRLPKGRALNEEELSRI